MRHSEARFSREVFFGVFVAVFLAVGLGVETPLAQAKGPAKPLVGQRTAGAQNKALLEQGLAALTAKDLPLATRLLSEAYRLSPRPEILFQLARLAIAENRALDAHDLFRRYLADPAREPDDEAQKTAEQFLTQPPPPSGSLTVQSDPGGLVVVDNRLVGTLPLPLPILLTPAAHNVIVEYPGKKLEAPVQPLIGRLTELRISRNSGAVLVSVLPAILLFSQYTNVAPEAARPFGDALEQAARGEQHTSLPAELVLSQAPELKTCLGTEPCQRQLAQKNKIDLLLQQRIVLKGDPKHLDFSLHLRLLRGDIAEPAAVAEAKCAPCTSEQAALRLREEAARLLSQGLYRPHGTLSVTAEPPTAALRIGDSEPVPAPRTLGLWVGSFAVKASFPGYKTEERTVEIADGKSTELRIELSKDDTAAVAVSATPATGPQPTGPLPRPKLRLALGGVMIALGVGMAITGGIGLANNGGCVDPPAVDGANCPTFYNTLGAGSFALGSGVLLIGSGIVLVALPERRRAPK